MKLFSVIYISSESFENYSIYVNEYVLNEKSCLRLITAMRSKTTKIKNVKLPPNAL